MSQSLIAELKAVRELISVPERWTQGVFACDEDGESYGHGFAPEAVCWCVHGAAEKVTERSFGLSDVLNSHGLTYEFNDQHTHAEVLAKLDEVIAQIEKE